MTRREKIVALALVSLVLLVLFMAFGTEYVGYPKVGGLSMEPTIQQWLYVPFGAPEVRHRGAYVHVDTNLEPRVGSIVMFRHDKDRDVKRIEKIREDGAVWLTADNVGVTGADSREYGWIARSDVIGVVDRIITPRRLVRILTTSGRQRNSLEMIYQPKKFVVNGSFSAGIMAGKITIRKSDQVLFEGPAFDYASGALYPIVVRNGRFVYKPANVGHSYAVFDPNASGLARTYSFNAMDELPSKIDGDALTGTAVVKPGAVVTFSKVRQITIDEQGEGHAVPTALVDGAKIVKCPMSTSVFVTREVRNIGNDAFVVTPS